jgi:hypothetical protein
MASETVTTGSTVETIDAVAGPTLGRPMRKALAAPTVPTSESAAIQAQPAGSK